MERICEFCCESRPIVYCQADSARLCLFCDSKVHSANALSNKHFRALLCEACGTQPASVNCIDHPLFMCRNCDCNLHDETTVQHQKRVMTGYLGCPSARDFAVLWGYDLNELKINYRSQDLNVSSRSSGSMVPNMEICREFQPWIDESSSTSEISSITSIFGAESELGSSNFHSKTFSKYQLLQDSHFVLQQVLNLDRLQQAERNNPSSRPCGQVRTAIYSGGNNTFGALGKKPDNNPPHLQGLSVDLQQAGTMNHEIHGQYFPFLVSQLEHLNTANDGIPFHGDPFWQSRSPAHSSQLWSQNMQDLGICEEIDSYPSYDGLCIPEVDPTFRNYEDLFSAGDQDQTRFLFDDMGMACSSTENDVSFDKSDNGYPRTDEVKSSS